MLIKNKNYKLLDYRNYLMEEHNVEFFHSMDIIFDYWVEHYPEEEKQWRKQYSKNYHDYEIPFTDRLEKHLALTLLQK